MKWGTLEPSTTEAAKASRATVQQRVRVGNHELGADRPAWIIAELGVNHDGSVARARELICRAAEAGANAVKIQAFVTDEIAAAGAPVSEYQRSDHRPSGARENQPLPLAGVASVAEPTDQRELLARLELSPSCFEELQDLAHSLGVEFFGSPFDLPSLASLLAIGVPAIKLGSGELTNVPLLRAAASSRKPLLLSTGMATWAEIRAAQEVVDEVGGGPVVFLQCVTSYPTPLEAANVRAVSELSARTGCLAGYSDHTTEREPSLAARALGACVLECHLTLDRGAPGPDHATSLDPEQFARWVASVRRLEAALGDGEKRHDEREEEGRRNARKRIVARMTIAPGERLTDEVLTTRRTGTASGSESVARAEVGAEHWDRVLGGYACRRIEAGEALTDEDLAQVLSDEQLSGGGESDEEESQS